MTIASIRPSLGGTAAGIHPEVSSPARHVKGVDLRTNSRREKRAHCNGVTNRVTAGRGLAEALSLVLCSLPFRGGWRGGGARNRRQRGSMTRHWDDSRGKWHRGGGYPVNISNCTGIGTLRTRGISLMRGQIEGNLPHYHQWLCRVFSVLLNPSGVFFRGGIRPRLAIR